MGQKQKQEQHEGGTKQTLKQAKAAFKARGGSSFVSEGEKRKLERGAVLLQRAERIREQEQRRKEGLEKKKKKKKREEEEASSTKSRSCLLGTQRVNDKFGYQRSQFHLGAFLKPKGPGPVSVQDDEDEPWDHDAVDDDTLLDMAGESPVTAKTHANLYDLQHTNHDLKHANHDLKYTNHDLKHAFPTVTDEHGSWEKFLDQNSQIARELSSTTSKPTPTPLHSSTRIPSFTSADFDLSVDDLEELDWVDADSTCFKPALSNMQRESWKLDEQDNRAVSEADLARKMMPPPSIPSKRLPASPSHGITLADLESLAGEEIQLSQFDSF
jgi:hypothetical protein